MTTQIAAVNTNGGANDFQTRQEQARLACEASGIVWPGTILPEGTALYSSGVETLKNDRAAWRRLPLAGEVIGLVAAALEAEDRKDFKDEKVGGLRFRVSDGRLTRAGLEHSTGPREALGYGPHALRQIMQQIDAIDDAPRGFSASLLYLSDQERAEILNKRIRETDPETAVTLRTRLPHNGETRITRAALSKVYGSVTDHDIAGAIGNVLQGDASGRLDYKPGDSRSRFEVIWPSEIPIETFVVGDVHYGMLSITNSETGEGSLRICPAVVRARCANLTLSTGEGTEIVIRHVGDEAALIHRLQKAIRSAIDDMEPLLATISQSARIVGSAWTPAEALSKIAKRYELPKSAADAWVAQLGESQYPNSIWGLTAAISEAAHKQSNWTGEAEWERIGSDVQAKAVEVVRKGGQQERALEMALAIN